MGTSFDIYLDVIIFLVVSILVVLISKRIKTSPVLGYLIAGVIIGPHVTNIIDGIEASKHLAEFGIVFLLFTIGLELSPERLKELRRYVFGIGVLQFLLTGTVLGIIVYFLYSHSVNMAILLGGGLALSSTAVVLQVLADRNELSTRTGRVAFSILLLQDIAVVFLLIWVNTLAKHQTADIYTMGQDFLVAIGVLIIIVLIGYYILRPVYRHIASTRSYEMFMATTLLIVLSISLATGSVGLSMELGAFLAGLMLAETEYSHQIEADIKPYRSLLLGLFFITVGMAINPRILVSEWQLVFGGAFILLIAKAVLLFLITWAFRLPIKTCVKTGLLMAGGSEFIFVLLAQASDENIIPIELLQIVNVSVIFTMALTPLLASLGKKLGQKLPSPIGYALKRATEDSKELKNHIIIGGYGHVGEYVHQILSQHMISQVAIDMNMGRVARGREDDKASVFFGDARRVEIYRALGAERARAIVLTIGDFNAITRAVKILRTYFPEIPVYARVKDKQQAALLRKHNAHPVMPEAYAPSFQLGAAVLSLYKFSGDQIEQTMKAFKNDYFEPEEMGTGIPWQFMTAEDDDEDMPKPGIIMDP